MGHATMQRLCAQNARFNALAVGLLPIDAHVDLLEKAKAAALAFGAQTAPVPGQPPFGRMMTGLALAATGARLLWYRFEDKDCREPEGVRCNVVALALASLMNQSSTGLLDRERASRTWRRARQEA